MTEPITVTTEIKGDEFVFRGKTGEELQAAIKSTLETGNETLDLLAEFKQLVIAKGVFTASTNGSGTAKPAPAKKAAARAKDTAPPPEGVEFFEGDDGKSYATLECDHGPRLDLRGKGYRADLYCTLDTKNFKDKCPPIKL